MKIKMAKLIGPRKFEIVEEELRSLKDNEVLIKIKAAGICHSEMPQFQGRTTWVDKDGDHVGITDEINYPLILGHEPSGTIADIGPGVKKFKVGDKVAGLIRRSFASYAIATTQKITKVPNGVPLECALGEPLMCVSNIVRAATPELGDYVGVIGCGAMGLLTLAGLTKSAAREVIAIDLISSRLKIAKELGATIVLNPKEVNVENEVKKITKEKGLDVIVEITGKTAGFALANKLIRTFRGKILIPSYYAGQQTLDLTVGFYLMIKSPIIHSTHPWYSANYADDLEKGMWAFEKGIFPMDKLITHKFKLEDIEKGMKIAETGAEDYIKGIIMPEL